ncbi:methyltransferase domain-containing protein [Alkalihalobacillus oceani]|uniref:Methyltransferase domain-containing protein n=1 Tax=Halalkalibacter oceani TaxID=1653776 RepID=A0A9X2DMP9_9BACI|nr:class I SAM-dependent methyltransferase [Halalkalibacter oceani]MCM3713651.1 methyltransferase domain-containing protein [Halalkalibacter oceani]
MAMAKADKWNANLYDNKHAFVSQYGETLIGLLAPAEGEKILDLGCGTGDLTNQLSERGAIVTGVDQSTNMIDQAEQKYPHLQFDVMDGAELTYREQFDAVFSNAALHWMKKPEPVLAGIYRALKPGGRFVAEFGGQDNVAMVTNELRNEFEKRGMTDFSSRYPWYFPSIGDYTGKMEEAGFFVTFAEHIDRPTPLEGEEGLRNWLVMFAASFFEGIEEGLRQEIVKAVEQNLRATLYQETGWVADYKRIRVIGKKQ